MQYNHYLPPSHQAHSPSQSTNDYLPPYPDSSHHHAALSDAAVTSPPLMPTESIAHRVPPLYNYHYPQSSPVDHRSYYAAPPAPTIEQYPPSNASTTSYPTPNPSEPMSPPPSRHRTHLPHPQQQPQFIPTPSQAYQVSSSVGSAASPRSRPPVEPYYHMSPNPQHAAHAPVASPTHGTGGRSISAHVPGCSHSHHRPHAMTHTGTIVVAAGDRYACDRCDRSFTRLHDRRRHYETVHSTSPVLHKCRYCRKDFSRSDSLKRHVDNGCDEMPR